MRTLVAGLLLSVGGLGLVPVAHAADEQGSDAQGFVATDAATCEALTGVSVGDPPAPTPFSAFTGDVKDVAETMGVSVTDALEIERYKWKLSELNLPYVDPGYAEFGSDPSLPFHGWYATASQDVTQVKEALDSAGLSDVVEIRHVPFSDCQTQAAYSRASADLGSWPHGGRVDVMTGTIVFTAADPDRQPLPSPESMTMAEKDAAPVPIDWAGDGAHVYKAQVHGGEDWGTGTAGFVVSRYANLDKGISTAYHVGVSGQYQGQSVVYQDGQYSGSVDAKWYDDYNDDVLWSANYWTGNSVQEVNGRRDRSQMGIGDTVCHYGAGTGEKRCGVIWSKSEGSDVPNSNATWIGVKPAPGCSSGCDMGKPGDSGGPWFYSNVAYGLHQGGASGGYAIFMAQNYLDNIGVFVTIHS